MTSAKKGKMIEWNLFYAIVYDSIAHTVQLTRDSLRYPRVWLMAVFVTNWCNFIHLDMFAHVSTYQKTSNQSVWNSWLNVCMAKYKANSTLCRNCWLSQGKHVFCSSAVLPEEAQALWSVLSQHSDKICAWGICSKKVSAMYLSIDRSLFWVVSS